jgi:hypothetical protein
MNHYRVLEFLPDFVEGELADELHASVESHVLTCAECKDWIRTYDLFAEHIDGRSDREHPDCGILALCAVRPEERFEPDRIAVRQHLDWCVRCRDELELMRAAICSARPSSASVRESDPARRSHHLAIGVAAGFAAVAISGVLLFGPWRGGQPLFSHADRTMQLAATSQRGTHANSAHELSGTEIGGSRLIEVPGEITISQTKINSGAEVTIRAGDFVAFGNGVQIEQRTRVAIGGRPSDVSGEHRQLHDG